MKTKDIYYISRLHSDYTNWEAQWKNGISALLSFSKRKITSRKWYITTAFIPRILCLSFYYELPSPYKYLGCFNTQFCQIEDFITRTIFPVNLSIMQKNYVHFHFKVTFKVYYNFILIFIKTFMDCTDIFKWTKNKGGRSFEEFNEIVILSIVNS